MEVRPGVSGDTGHDPWRGAAWSWVNKESQASAGSGLVRLSKAKGLQITGCERTEPPHCEGVIAWLVWGLSMSELLELLYEVLLRDKPAQKLKCMCLTGFDICKPPKLSYTYPRVEHCLRLQCGGHGAQLRLKADHGVES
jgi:hypothetical protein